jgi:hypothetical protein
MNQNTIFTQLMKLIAPTHREAIFDKHLNNRFVKKFSGWQHFLVLFVAQIKGLKSLRDIVTTLGTHSTKHYHMGLKSRRAAYQTVRELFRLDIDGDKGIPATCGEPVEPWLERYRPLAICSIPLCRSEGYGIPVLAGLSFVCILPFGIHTFMLLLPKGFSPKTGSFWKYPRLRTFARRSCGGSRSLPYC